MGSGHAIFTRIHSEAKLPTWGTVESVGFDLYTIEDVTVRPGEVVLVRTGLVAKPPLGCHFELVLRSGVAVKNPGLVLANGVGIIDPDYSGDTDEIKIALLNTTCEAFTVKERHTTKLCGNGQRYFHFPKGTRLAQLILRETLRPEIHESKKTMRTSGSRDGFGSTGE